MRRALVAALLVLVGCVDDRQCHVTVPAHLAGASAPAASELQALLGDAARRLEAKSDRPAPLIGRLRYLAATFDSGPAASCMALREARSSLEQARSVEPAERNAVTLVLDLAAVRMAGPAPQQP